MAIYKEFLGGSLSASIRSNGQYLTLLHPKLGELELHHSSEISWLTLRLGRFAGKPKTLIELGKLWIELNGRNQLDINWLHCK